VCALQLRALHAFGFLSLAGSHAADMTGVRKLRTHSAAQLVARAFKDGLLNSSDFD
jgi:hypothetical protein